MGFFFKSASEKAYDAVLGRVLSRYKTLLTESPLKEPFEIALTIWTEEMRGRSRTVYVTQVFAAPLLKFVVMLDAADALQMLAQLIAAHTDEKFRDTKLGASLDQNLGTLVHMEKTEFDELNRAFESHSPNSYKGLCDALGKKPFYPGSIDDHGSRLFMRSLVAGLYGCDAKGRRW